MASLRSLRRRIQRYTVFGPIGGARVAALALLHRLGGRERIVRVRAAGLAHPVHLRPGTSDVWILDQVVTKREYAVDGIAPARAIVDAGANIGLATAFFATEHPTATILAIEPEAANHALLVQNSAPYPNVV